MGPHGALLIITTGHLYGPVWLQVCGATAVRALLRVLATNPLTHHDHAAVQPSHMAMNSWHDRATRASGSAGPQVPSKLPPS